MSGYLHVMSVHVYFWTDKMAGRKPCAGSEVPGPSKTSKRQVTKATFEKWQQEYEKDHQTRSWLRCDLDRDKRHVSSLYCTVCRKYEDSLQSLKSFSQAWIVGSTNHKVSNVIDHATSEVQRWLAWERIIWRSLRTFYKLNTYSHLLSPSSL